MPHPHFQSQFQFQKNQQIIKMEKDTSKGVWLGKRPISMQNYYANLGVKYATKLANRLTHFDFNHHVVRIDGTIYHLVKTKTSEGQLIRVLPDYLSQTKEFEWQEKGKKTRQFQDFMSTVNDGTSNYQLTTKNCQDLAEMLCDYVTGKRNLISAVYKFAKRNQIQQIRFEEEQKKKKEEQQKKKEEEEAQRQKQRIAALQQAQTVYHHPVKHKPKKKPTNTSSNWRPPRR